MERLWLQPPGISNIPKQRDRRFQRKRIDEASYVPSNPPHTCETVLAALVPASLAPAIGPFQGLLDYHTW